MVKSTVVQTAATRSLIRGHTELLACFVSKGYFQSLMTDPKSTSSPVTAALCNFDRSIIASCGGCIVGIDEAGRGPLAGPVVAAAVVLDLDKSIPGVNDSKKLGAARPRKALRPYRRRSAGLRRGSGVGGGDREARHPAGDISCHAAALEGIAAPWTLALVDGNQPIRGLASERQQTVVRGDGHSASIAAASIIAKSRATGS